jgi:hypothetical protein
MPRRKPTEGTTEFFSTYIDSFVAHAQTDWTPTNRDAVTLELNKLGTAKGAFGRLSALQQVDSIPPAIKLDVDQTPMARIDGGWHRLAMEHLVDRFGRYGQDAVGGIAEAMLYANALATAFGTHYIYYRGEHRYGHPLQSSAERKLGEHIDMAPGLTAREIDELRRFQDQVLGHPETYPELATDPALANTNSPRWLPVMQHYDDEFGTRLLDVTTSVFAGLYFACVSWDGTINSEIDGLLYVFLRGNGGLIARGCYYEHAPPNFDPEYDDVTPESILDSFKSWDHPEVTRIYRSSTMSERELAQDGLFFVKGSLDEGPGLGQGFKLRVPAEIKETVAKELWWAGYTPRRILRGPRGESAHRKLAGRLGMPID